MLRGLNVQQGDVKTSGRVKYLPDDNGVYYPYELTVCDRLMFKPQGWETSEAEEDSTPRGGSSDPEENRRKSFARARNNLFDLLLCTPSMDCFVTLTVSPDVIDKRSDYNEVVKRLSVWLDNRVRRNGLVYVLVPEYHKDGESVHFHGLMNFEALKTVRAINQKEGSWYFGKELFDDKGREIFNISDYRLGFSTVIPIDGEHGREACAKYCYKYIIKSGGQKVGGRYYLSGGNLGRPKYEYINVSIDDYEGEAFNVGGTGIMMKKVRLQSDVQNKA